MVMIDISACRLLSCKVQCSYCVQCTVLMVNAFSSSLASFSVAQTRGHNCPTVGACKCVLLSMNRMMLECWGLPCGFYIHNVQQYQQPVIPGTGNCFSPQGMLFKAVKTSEDLRNTVPLVLSTCKHPILPLSSTLHNTGPQHVSWLLQWLVQRQYLEIHPPLAWSQLRKYL